MLTVTVVGVPSSFTSNTHYINFSVNNTNTTVDDKRLTVDLATLIRMNLVYQQVEL
jgi:hypothetical protein